MKNNSETVFQTWFKNNQYAVFTMDHQGLLLEANDQVFRQLGISQKQFFHLSFFDLFAWPELQAKFKKPGEKNGELSDGIYQIKRKDNKPVELTVSTVSYKGRKLLLCQLRDITAKNKSNYIARELESDAITGKQVENDLKMQFSIMQSIMKSTDAIVFSVDRDYKYTGFNERHASVMKQIYNKEPKIGLSIMSIMSVKKDRLTAKSNLDRALAGEELIQEAYSGEELLSRRYFRVSHNPIKIESGEIIGVVVLAQDITDLKKSEETLHKEARRGNLLLELYEKSPQMSEKQLYDYALEHAVSLTDSIIGFFHLMADDQKTIIFTTWNKEILKNCTASYDTHYSIDEAGNWVDCVRLKRPVIYNDYHSSPNQKGLPEGHSVLNRFMSVPVMEDDKVRIIFGVGNKTEPYDNRDVVNIQLVANELQKIIRQRKAEEALRLREERFRLIAENTADTIAVLDLELKITYVSPSVLKLRGYTVDESVSQTIDQIFTPDSLQKIKKVFNEQMVMEASGEADPYRTVSLELEEYCKDGSTIWVETTVSSIRDENLKPTGILTVSRDIAQRKQAEEALHRAYDEMEQKVEERTAELKKANEQLTALYKVGQIISEPLNLKKVLDLIARNTAKLLGSDTGVILLIDKTGETLTIQGAYGLSKEVVNGTRDRIGESIAGRVVQTGQPIIANDLPNDKRFYNPAAANEGLLACASVPLLAGGKIIGTLDIHSKTNRYAFNEKHIYILQMIASQAATAIENARLYEQLQSVRDELEIRVQQRTSELVSANEKLERILKFNEALLSAVPTPVFYKDKKGRYLGCNHAFTEIMGVTADQIKGKTVYELWPAEHAKKYHSQDLKLMKNPEKQIYEFKVRDKNGFERPIIYYKDVFRDEDDQVAGIVGAFIDITDIKRIEIELQRSNSLLRAIIEAAPTAIFDLDLDGNVKAVWNPAAEKMLGWRADEVIGKPLPSVTPEKQEESRQFREQIRSGKTLNGIEVRRQKRDGTPIDYCIYASPLFDSDGIITGNVAVLTDITDRKAAEREIAQMNRALRMLSNANQVLIHSTNEKSLYEEICSSIVETGGYLMAWVGLAEYDEQKSICKVAQVGQDDSYIESARLSWADNKTGKNPCGIAIRSGEPYIVSDVGSDPITDTWRKAAIRHGYKSVIALPLINEGQILGALSIYSGETDAFTDKEVAILNELADDLALGISALRSQINKNKAEEALRISEENYRILFEDNPTMYFTVNKEGLIQSVNRFGCEQLGYTYEELIGKPVLNVFFREDHEMVTKHLQECINEPNLAHSWELRKVHKSNRIIWVRETAKAITAKDGNLLVLIVCEDITEHKQSLVVQAAIYRISEAAQTTANLYELFDSIHAIVAELMPARNFFIALYNPDTEIIDFPYYADEFDSMPPPTKIGKGLTDYVIRTGKPLLTTPLVFEQLIESGQVESIGTPSIDWIGVPLKTREGETIGVMAVQTYTESVRLNVKHQDIMEFVSTQVAMAIERKRTEEALQHSEEKYRTLVENLSDVIFTLDTEGHFIYISSAIEKYTGFTPEQIIGQSFSRYIYPDDLPGLIASFQRSLAGNIEPYEFRIYDKDGFVHHVRTSSQILTEKGGIIGLSGIMSDITQLKKNEEELIKAKEKAEESNRLKSAFLATMNHELRTPLNHILGFSDLMRSGDISENISDYADVIFNSSLNLLEIIEDIFNLALAEQSEILLRSQTFRCLDLFLGNKSVLTEILETSGKKDQIKLVFNADRELLLKNITTDRNKINQVLINLFKNAVKFTKSGKIEFGMKTEKPGWLTFYVEDTGIGIPENKHDIIFEFFRQADDSDTREYGGVGIGLAISKKIAEVMSGNLNLESVPGEGSKFYFTIPVTTTNLMDSQYVEEYKKNTVPDLHDKTILIAEDDPMSIDLLKRYLIDTGARIIEAANGKEVIEKLNSNPDVVLMDLNMPVMDGYTATEIVKSRKPYIPVIAVTAFALSAEKSKAIKAGCDGIISKPINQQILLGELIKHLLPH